MGKRTQTPEPAPGMPPAQLSAAMRADLDARLARIEGHVAGIRKMLDGNESCDALMMQLAAVRAATTQTIAKLFEGQLETCVHESVRTGKGEEALGRLKGAFSTLLRQV